MFNKIFPCFSILQSLVGKKLLIVALAFFLLPFEMLIAQLVDSPWPMYQHDSRHTGKSQYSGVRNPTLAWSYKICDDSLTVGDIVVGTDGTIYIPVSNGTGMSAKEGFLYAINPDGTFKWKFQFEGICVPALTVPAIASDGTIYVHVNGDANVAAQERIYAINPDGTKKWEYLEDVAAFVAIDLSSPVIANDGSITYTSMNTASTRISSNGEWLADLLDNYYNSIHSSPALISGDTIYVSEDGAIKAYQSLGGLIWTADLSGDGSSGFNGSPSIDTDGTIYYANHNFVYAISSNSTIKWTYPIHTSAPIYSNYYSTPAISNDGPIFSTATELIALGRDGTLRWKVPSSFEDPEDRWSYVSPTIGSDGLIYWQCFDSWGFFASLIIIDNGSIISQFDLPYGEWGSPVSPGSPRQSAIIMPDSTTLCISGVYLLAIKNYDSPTFAEQVGSDKSVTYELHQNYPNPFNPITRISYSIPNSSFTTLKIYDILGREIQTLVSEFQKADRYFINFDASWLSSGTYFYKLQAGCDFVDTKKMMLKR